MNDSITSGVFPSTLKHAKVIPIYKNEDVTDPFLIESLKNLRYFLEDRNML